jgi:hypothetical protein
MSEAQRYYVEFRVAENGVYGHSYVAYGRLDGRGRPVSARYADVHPTGELLSAVVGHFLPMVAETEPDPETLRLPIVSHYRLTLSARQYRHLVAAVSRTRSAVQGWSIVAYNCNDFVADVAKSLGLRTPNSLTLPYDFIPMLRQMNARRPAGMASGHVAPAASNRTALVR